MARLVDLASGCGLELPPQRTTFGTAPDNSIPVAEGFDVRPQHFQLMPVPGGCVLVDMTGVQATLVNGQPASQVMLKNGDVVTAGRLAMRYECQVVPPPLPPEIPPVPPVAPGNTVGPPLPGTGYGIPPQLSVASRAGSKVPAFEKGGTSSVPNVATAIHLYKWMLPVLGLVIWAVRWCYNIYSVKSEMDDAEIRGVAYAMVETFREAREAKAPLIENVHDAKHAVRILLRGVEGSGEYAGCEFKVDVTNDQAEDALDLLMWTEGSGLLLKHEYREKNTHREEPEEVADPGEEMEDLIIGEEI